MTSFPSFIQSKLWHKAHHGQNVSRLLNTPSRGQVYINCVCKEPLKSSCKVRRIHFQRYHVMQSVTMLQ
jgi:hypothetical protein